MNNTNITKSTTKKQISEEIRLDKVFTLQDYFEYQESKQANKFIEIEINNENPKIIEPHANLILPDNLANLLIVRKSCIQLTNNNKWTWQLALRRLMPEYIAIKIINIKDKIQREITENDKFRLAFSTYIQNKCNISDPFLDQYRYIEKFRRHWLQDDYQLNPKQYYEVLEEANDLLPYINPEKSEPNENSKLNSDSLWTTFHQSLPVEWENEAKDIGILKNHKKFFNFVIRKHNNKLIEKQNKKRKNDDSTTTSKKQKKFNNFTNKSNIQNTSFLSNKICYKCKGIGHLANVCPSKNQFHFQTSNSSVNTNNNSTSNSYSQNTYQNFRGRGRGRGGRFYQNNQGRFNQGRGNFEFSRGRGYNNQPPNQNNTEILNFQDDISSITNSNAFENNTLNQNNQNNRWNSWTQHRW